MEIQIKYSSPFENIEIYINSVKNIFTCNGKDVKASIFLFKEKLFDIVITWENNTHIEDIKDSEFYMIKIVTEEDSYLFSSNSDYPENFQEFKNLLMEVLNG